MGRKRKQPPDKTSKETGNNSFDVDTVVDGSRKRKPSTRNAEKRALGKDAIIRTRLCSFNSLHPIDGLKDVIEAKVQCFSQLSHHAAQLATLYTLRRLELEDELASLISLDIDQRTASWVSDCDRCRALLCTPFDISQRFYDKCMRALTSSRDIDCPLLRDCAAHFPRHDIWGFAELLPPVARQMGTAAENSMFTCFEQRQKKTLRFQLEEESIPREVVTAYDVQQLVNAPLYEIHEDARVNRIVEEHRTILRTSQGVQVNTEWCQKNALNVLRYYRHLLTIRIRLQRQRFSLLPQKGYGVKFLPIETDGLFYLLKTAFANNDDIRKQDPDSQIRLKLPSTKPEFGKEQEWWWSVAFSIPRRLLRGGWTFNFSLRTDGVSARVTIWRRIRYSEDTDVLLHRYQVEQRRLVAASEVNFSTLRDVDWITIDPGRRDLVYTYDMSSEATRAFSKAQYYEEAGFNRHKRKREHVMQRECQTNPQLHGVFELLKQHSLKVCTSAQYIETLHVHHSVERLMFTLYSLRIFRRLGFDALIRKPRALDRFFNGLRDTVGREKAVFVAYGAAKFNPTSKGDVSGPTATIAKRCSLHFPTIYLPEQNTSKKHFDCQCTVEKRLMPATFERWEKNPSSEEEKRAIETRFERPGFFAQRFRHRMKTWVEDTRRDPWVLRWCPSPSCRKFLHRDLNACKNDGAIIEASLEAGVYTRPEYLKTKTVAGGRCRDDPSGSPTSRTTGRTSDACQRQR